MYIRPYEPRLLRLILRMRQGTLESRFFNHALVGTLPANKGVVIHSTALKAFECNVSGGYRNRVSSSCEWNVIVIVRAGAASKYTRLSDRLGSESMCGNSGRPLPQNLTGH